MTEIMRASYITFTIMIASMLIGCVTVEQEPTLVAEARSYSRDGHEAYREGKLESSKQAYGRALKIHHTIDDSMGIVRDLINLAVVSKASGNRSDAIECLDAIDRYVTNLRVSSSDTPQPKGLNILLLEAGWMRAYMDCDAGRPQQARQRLAATTANHGPPDRELEGRFLNLEARLDLEEGDPTRGYATATRALKANKRSRNTCETADSYRIIGRALIKTGSPERALVSFEQALQIDREQGRPSKVIDDLLGMSLASHAAGNFEQARASADRARIAARAAGDTVAESKTHRMTKKF